MTFARRVVCDDNWPDVLKLMRPSIEREGVDEALLLGELVAHRSQLWTNDDWTVGLVTESRRDGALILHLISGPDMRSWIADNHAAVVETATAAGFLTIESTGRKAWVRWLGPLGYRPIAEGPHGITLSKRL